MAQGSHLSPRGGGGSAAPLRTCTRSAWSAAPERLPLLLPESTSMRRLEMSEPGVPASGSGVEAPAA
eukprot:11209766-Lingulodinium_polyedra.AAC.1